MKTPSQWPNKEEEVGVFSEELRIEVVSIRIIEEGAPAHVEM